MFGHALQVSNRKLCATSDAEEARPIQGGRKYPVDIVGRAFNIARKMAEFAATRPVLEAKGLSKSFPGVMALEEVSLEIWPGTVHAVMGENGAGKSTLMRILTGLEAPDAGEIRFNGQSVRVRSPHDAMKLGIAMIHQELMPFPEMSVAENIFMGREPVTLLPGWLDRRAMQSEARRLLERLGFDRSPAARMGELTVAEMQTVEIAKALARRAEVIIMDEPTSAISDREFEALVRIIRDLKHQGVAVIYISHKMDEVFRLADSVTVLRDGRRVACRPIAELNRAGLIQLMVGRELNHGLQPRGAPPGPEVLAVRGLSKVGRFHDVNLTIRQGEIVGLAGLMGAGRTDLARAIAGLTPADSGMIHLNGRPARIKSPAQAMAQGVAMVNEDRKREGLVLGMSVEQNLTLSNLARYCRGGFVDARQERKIADDQIRAFSIKTPNRHQPTRYLSGGNQQKVVLAKTLLVEPAVLILDEPTRGIDVGARAEIYDLIDRLARAGKAILLISSELAEILLLSSRILVMRKGRLTAELDPARTSQEEILKHAMPD
jgi:inositol transport system ATP-binding protein